ncbi:MAG TPA: universal stress protein [Mucilaginibacter sp.]|nr:universal stress protein [Mucilaginibacter sp.]
MKTILVLTDFSINAECAADYALRLAQKLAADLLLCNVYREVPEEQTDYPAPWTVIAGKNSIEDLGALAAKLKARLDADVAGNSFRPEIAQCSKEGTIGCVLNELSKKHDILLAVISNHQTHFFTEFLSVNHAREIIDGAHFPVLVVPYQVHFNNFKTIAFATNLESADVDALQSLSALAAACDSKVMVTHVAVNGKDVEAGRINELIGRLNYPQLSSRVIKNGDVASGLTALQKETDVDLLALVYRRRNFFQKLYEGHIIPDLLKRPVKPMLIFPHLSYLEE